jgi:hypothetical protein
MATISNATITSTNVKPRLRVRLQLGLRLRLGPACRHGRRFTSVSPADPN